MVECVVWGRRRTGDVDHESLYGLVLKKEDGDIPFSSSLKPMPANGYLFASKHKYTYIDMYVYIYIYIRRYIYIYYIYIYYNMCTFI